MAGDVASELRWLKKWPQFEERPATVVEFLGPEYLNIDKGVRGSIRAALTEIMGEEVLGDRLTRYSLGMITGGIGIGKTTIASIVLPWMVHYVLCLKNPQDYFDLLPGSRIAFMQMSTSESQAKEVLFGDIKARINYSPWFRDRYPFDTAYKNQLRFPKDIWILPGDSGETTFEGYNILGGILDEADSHKVTPQKSYAENGYNTIHARITSRFQERGFLLVIGQMKEAHGFAAQKYKEFSERDDAYAVRMSIWESMGWEKFLKPNGERDSFFYDPKRKQIVPGGIAKELGRDVMEIPNVYRRDFQNKPEKALKDLAGIPPEVGDPFINLTYKVDEAQERWHERFGPDSPINENGKLQSWFKSTNSLKRVAHIDIAYSAEGDACGFALGHVRSVVDVDGEKKPYIVFDLLARWKARPGTEIMLSDVRHFLYSLRDDCGFRIIRVTTDGFQSTDTLQQLRRRRFETEKVSVDTDLLPYYDLRDALYEDRIEFPKYMVYLNHGDDNLVNVAYKELSQLEDTGKKIDHPKIGSKDVSDAMAGVTYTLMGDRQFRKGRTSFGQAGQPPTPGSKDDALSILRGGGGFNHPALTNLAGVSAPLPPSAGHFPGGPPRI